MTEGRGAPPGLIVDGRYSDKRFIDRMAAHHLAAVEMAKVARQNGEHQEIRQLAEEEISGQQNQVEELARIKQRASGSAKVATEMSPEDPSVFAMLGPSQLAAQRPFDKAFIDSAIPHHAAAIEMAGVALMQSEEPEIKRLARKILDAQALETG